MDDSGSSSCNSPKRGRKRMADADNLRSTEDLEKKQKNREAARKCRKKKMKESEELKKRNECLEAENESLAKRKIILEGIVRDLYKTIKDHANQGCQISSNELSSWEHLLTHELACKTTPINNLTTDKSEPLSNDQYKSGHQQPSSSPSQDQITAMSPVVPSSSIVSSSADTTMLTLFSGKPMPNNAVQVTNTKTRPPSVSFLSSTPNSEPSLDQRGQCSGNVTNIPMIMALHDEHHTSNGSIMAGNGHLNNNLSHLSAIDILQSSNPNVTYECVKYSEDNQKPIHQRVSEQYKDSSVINKALEEPDILSEVNEETHSFSTRTVSVSKQVMFSGAVISIQESLASKNVKVPDYTITATTPVSYNIEGPRAQESDLNLNPDGFDFHRTFEINNASQGVSRICENENGNTVHISGSPSFINGNERMPSMTSPNGSEQLSTDISFPDALAQGLLSFSSSEIAPSLQQQIRSEYGSSPLASSLPTSLQSNYDSLGQSSVEPAMYQSSVTSSSNMSLIQSIQNMDPLRGEEQSFQSQLSFQPNVNGSECENTAASAAVVFHNGQSLFLELDADGKVTLINDLTNQIMSNTGAERNSTEQMNAEQKFEQMDGGSVSDQSHSVLMAPEISQSSAITEKSTMCTEFSSFSEAGFNSSHLPRFESLT